MATYCSRRGNEGLAWRDVFRVLILAGIPIVLVLIQPDLGTAIIMTARAPRHVGRGRAPPPAASWSSWWSGPRPLVPAVGPREPGCLHKYQINRLTTFLHPNSHSTNPLRAVGASTTLQQAKNAIGSGGVFGSGIGHGVETNLGLRARAADRLHLHGGGGAAGVRWGPSGCWPCWASIAWRVLACRGRRPGRLRPAPLQPASSPSSPSASSRTPA